MNPPDTLIELKASSFQTDKTDSLESNEKIVLNARGIKYEVFVHILDRLPESRLASLKRFHTLNKSDKRTAQELFRFERICDHLDEEAKPNEYYFNRDPTVLNIVLNFYQEELINGKKYHLNLNVFCVQSLLDEFRYWRIEDFPSYLHPCCIFKIENEIEKSIDEKRKEEEILDELNYKENFGKYCFPRFRQATWNILEHPSTSIYAKV
jgi:hypothetical protein